MANKFEEMPGSLDVIKREIIKEITDMDPRNLEAVRTRLAIPYIENPDELKEIIVKYMESEIKTDTDALAMKNVIMASKEHGPFEPISEYDGEKGPNVEQ